jgi:hypothetical protein
VISHPVTKQTSLRGAKKIPSLCSEQASNLMPFGESS